MEAQKIITFKESSLYSLMNEMLVDYIQYCHKEFSIDETSPLTITKEEEIPYLSEWFDRKGFDWLNEIEQYFFEEDKKYRDFVELQRLVWTLNKDTDDLVHLFVTFINYMSNVVEFLRTQARYDVLGEKS